MSTNEGNIEVRVRSITANWTVLKTLNGAFMFSQTIFNIIDLAILCSIGSTKYGFGLSHDLMALMLVNCTFFISTLLMLVSSVFSVSTIAILPESSFFSLYNLVATILYLCTSLSVVIERTYWRYTGSALASGVIGLVITCLYAVGTVFSLKTFFR